jgi:hypothetical protein
MGPFYSIYMTVSLTDGPILQYIYTKLSLTDGPIAQYIYDSVIDGWAHRAVYI